MGKPSAPEPPDPRETATAQTGTNISTATANALLGNVNQITPYGSLTYKQTGQNFVNDANGSKWYVGPNGQYTQTMPTGQATGGGAPQHAGGKPVVTQGRNGGGNAQLNGPTGGTDMSGGGGSNTLTGSAGRDTMTNSSLPTGWREVNGYYIPTFTATQTLSPTEQAKFDASQQAQINLANLAKDQSARLGGLLNRPMDLSKLPAGGNAADLTMPQYQQFSNGNPLQTQIAGAGNITRNIADAGNIANTFGDAGALTRSYGTDFSADRQRVEDALMQRLNPSLQGQDEALRTRLENQGIKAGSEAYNRAIDESNRNIVDARLGAVLAGGEEQSRLAGLERDRATFQNSAQQQAYNQALGRGTFANQAQQQRFDQNADRATFANQAQQQQFGQNSDRASFSNLATQQMNDNRFRATSGNNSLQDQRLNSQLARFNAQNTQRNQALQETFATRNQPLNEISALLSGSQVTAPQWANTNMPTIPTVDYAGLVNENYNQRLGAWQQQNANAQGLLGGLFGLGGKLIGLSDAREKVDVSRVGTLDNGLGVYVYRYRDGGSWQIGVLAQEVEQIMPAAVSELGGVKIVDHGKLREAA